LKRGGGKEKSRKEEEGEGEQARTYILKLGR
jgi:hypothetical protein